MHKLTTYFIIFSLFTATQLVYAAGLDDFIITVQPDIEGPSTQFTISTTGVGYNYNVDCNNDGNHEFTAQTGDVICEYSDLAATGTYTIRIEDNSGLGTGFPRIYFDNRSRRKIIGINQWGTGQWKSMISAFSGCIHLNDAGGAATDMPDLSAVTDMSSMFFNAWRFNQDIGDWNTSNVENMSGMFREASSFNRNIGAWDTSKVTIMNHMFEQALSFNQDISRWNTVNVIEMKNMFNSAVSFNQDIGNWNTANVIAMNGMFSGAVSFDQNIGNWNISTVKYMSSMFYGGSLSTGNYDSLLIGWSKQIVQPGVRFHGGGSKYCTGINARSRLTKGYGWKIADRGPNPNCFTVSATVSHLSGSNLLLQINGGNDLLVDNSSFYTFNKVLHNDSEYTVSILKQPINPDQHCTLTNAQGVVSGAHVSNVRVNCKAACNGSFVRLNDTQTAIDIVATGSDDTTNIQCALDLASQKGIPLVRLGKADYRITNIIAEEFNGSFQGTTRAYTRLFVERQGIDCKAMVISGFTPAAIKFIRGEPTLRYMTIIADRPCTTKPVLESLIHFTGRNAHDSSCKNDVIFGNIDRVDLLSSIVHGGIFNAIDVSPEARALGGCKNTLLGTFKLNQSSVNNFPVGINTTMSAGAVVDINFNAFNQNSTAISLTNTNQSTRIISNQIVRNTSVPRWPAIGVKISTSPSSAPSKTWVIINNNDFRFSKSNITDPRSTAISALSYRNIKVSMSVTNNRFTLDSRTLTVADIRDINNGEFSANHFSGTCASGLTLYSSFLPNVSNWTITSNSFEHLECLFGDDINLGPRTKQFIIGPGQGATIDDRGTENIVLPQ